MGFGRNLGGVKEMVKEFLHNKWQPQVALRVSLEGSESEQYMGFLK